MRRKIHIECSGYRYMQDDDKGNWGVETDYYHNKIYLSAPEDDDGIASIEAFGIAIGRAVRDMRHDLKDNN